mmetsp:Transcript_11732/g.38616  ORF Transcript_11732/g.38616 Transcript_11732/m.38616 type:complete len:307 (-) Transcript_11732:96-1016(-)
MVREARAPSPREDDETTGGPPLARRAHEVVHSTHSVVHSTHSEKKKTLTLTRGGGGDRRDSPPRLTLELVVAILEYVLDPLPPRETARLWPVVRAPAYEAHVRRDGDPFAIDTDFDVVLRDNTRVDDDDDDDDDDETFQLQGFWAAATPTSVRSFLCTAELDVDVDVAEAPKRLRGDRVYWLRRCVADDGSRRVVCCSVARDVVRSGLDDQRAANDPGAADDPGPSREERPSQVDVEVLGVDFGPRGTSFIYVPRGATLSKALRRHFALTVVVKHRIAEFVQADDVGFWVTDKDRRDTLANDRDKS